MNSLQVGEDLAAKGATAPRVALQHMEDKIVYEHCFTVGEAISHSTFAHPAPLDILTLCILVLDNGWTLVGKSAPAAPENFNAEKGRIFAREDALRQLWPLEGYALRERLAEQAQMQGDKA